MSCNLTCSWLINRLFQELLSDIDIKQAHINNYQEMFVSRQRFADVFARKQDMADAHAYLQVLRCVVLQYCGT